MLCYVTLCCDMLYYVMSCHVMLTILSYVKSCYVALWYDMLCYVMRCHIALYCVMLCSVMWCLVMLCYVMLCYVILCHDMLCYVMSRFIITIVKFFIFSSTFYLPPLLTHSIINFSVICICAIFGYIFYFIWYILSSCIT